MSEPSGTKELSVLGSSNETDTWARDLVGLLWKEEMDLQEFHDRVFSALKGRLCKEEQAVLLAEYLLRVATLTAFPYTRFLSYLKVMAIGKMISWPCFLGKIVAFHRVADFRCVAALSDLLVEMSSLIDCQYSIESECFELSHNISLLLHWLVKSLQECEREGFEDSIPPLIRTTLKYSGTRFFSSLMKARHFTDEDLEMELVPASKALLKLNPQRAEYSTIVENIENFTVPPEYNGKDYLVNHLYKSYSIVRTTTAVYANYRILSSVDEVADALVMMGGVAEMTRVQILQDSFDASFAILAEEEEGSERYLRSLIESFIILKLPLVLKVLLKSHGFMSQEVFEALVHTAQSSAAVLDSLDEVLLDDVWEKFLCQLVDATILDSASQRILVNKRQQTRRTPQECRRDSSKHNMLIFPAHKATKAYEGISWKELNKMTPLLTTLCASGGFAFDAFCATFCVHGNLSDFSSQLASANSSLERVDTVQREDRRWSKFDLTFLVLNRIALNYDRLSLRELVNGLGDKYGDHTDGMFYRWARRFIRPDELEQEETEKEKNEKNRALAKEHLNQLIQGNIFWDEDTADYGEVLEWAPFFGELLLDDYSHGAKHSHLEYDINSLMRGLWNAPSLLMCLVEWLHVKRHNDSRQLLARCIKLAIDNNFPTVKEEKDRWVYCRHTIMSALDEMIEGKRVTDPFTIQPHTLVHRPLPTLQRFELPDKEVLKKALVYASRQRWAPPGVLTLLEACNRASLHKSWVESWLRYVSKATTNEDMICGMELIFGVALLDPLPSFRAICQVLGDFVLSASSESDVGLAVCPPIGIFNARFLALVMVLSTWAKQVAEMQLEALESAADEAPLVKKRRTSIPDNISSEDDFPGLMREHLKELEGTLATIFVRMRRNSLQGRLRNVVAFICIVLHELARARRSSAWSALVSSLPHDLLFVLGRIDPHMMTFELFCVFCSDKDKLHGSERLRYACMARKLGAM